MLNNFLCVYWPFVYLLWINAYSKFLSIFKKLHYLPFIIEMQESLHTVDTSCLSDIWFEYISSHYWVIFFTIVMVLFLSLHIIFKAFIYDTHHPHHENYWKCLTRTISQSTFNSVATASIFSLQIEPRLVMPLSQYFLRVAKSLSLNWVRSCSCRTNFKNQNNQKKYYKTLAG